jgi:hypothetical protein
VGHHQLDEVSAWVTQAGEGAPGVLRQALQAARTPGFHYSRLMAVGLLSLLEGAKGAEALDPQALRGKAHDLAESMGLLRERVDKDLALYVTNLEKMAQAVELMEETVAAERRRRERQARTQALIAEAQESSSGDGSSGDDPSGPGAAAGGASSGEGTASQPASP